MTGESGLMDSAYGGDPLAILGDELRERGIGEDESIVSTETVARGYVFMLPASMLSQGSAPEDSWLSVLACLTPSAQYQHPVPVCSSHSPFPAPR